MSTPYDPQKSRKLLQIAQAYASSPMGGYLSELAEQLVQAEAEITAANSRANTAEQAINKAEAELESAQQSVRRLRAGSNGLTEAVDALKVIAANPKGAAKIASEVLAKINGAVSS